MRIDTFGQSEVSDQTILIPYPVARYFTGNRYGEGDLFQHGEYEGRDTGGERNS